MLTAAAYIKILVALTVVANPFGIIPVLVSMTAQQSVIERKGIARIAGLAVGVATWIDLRVATRVGRY